MLQEDQKACRAEDGSSPARSRSREELSTKQLEFPAFAAQLQVAMEQFIDWYCSEPRLALNRTVVLRFRLHSNRSH